MSSKILSKYKQTLIEKFIDAVESPVVSVQIASGGTGYANGEELIFSSGTAAGKVFTDGSGVIQEVALTARGSYLTPPTITVNTAVGVSANLIAILENDYYYLYAARSKPYPADPTPTAVIENPDQAFYEQHQQLMFGARVNKDDMVRMVRRITWTANTVFAQYDDKNPDLVESDFYVVTSENKVYKCIFNVNGSPSTEEPNHTEDDGLPPREVDGYRWKYLYTISSSENAKFSTTNFIPVIPNANVQAAAVTIDGAILNVKVENFGSNYPAHSGQITTSVNTTVIQIGNTASDIPAFYNNCSISVINSGTNEVVNRIILSSSANSTGKFVTVTPSFLANQIANGFSYTIGPTIRVVGNGTGWSGRAIMNEVSGAITRVETIDGGLGYTRAEAFVQSSPAFGAGAQVRAIISPPGGHGANVYSELYVQHIALTGDFSNSFVIGFPSEVTFRTVGLLKNPTKYNDPVQLFTNDTFTQTVHIAASNTSAAQLIPGELITGNISTARARVSFANSTVIIATGYEGTFVASDIITGANSTAQYIVSSVTQNPELQIYSGEILYLQNVQPIARSNTSTEQVKLVIKL